MTSATGDEQSNIYSKIIPSVSNMSSSRLDNLKKQTLVGQTKLEYKLHLQD